MKHNGVDLKEDIGYSKSESQIHASADNNRFFEHNYLHDQLTFIVNGLSHTGLASFTVSYGALPSIVLKFDRSIYILGMIRRCCPHPFCTLQKGTL